MLHFSFKAVWTEPYTQGHTLAQTAGGKRCCWNMVTYCRADCIICDCGTDPGGLRACCMYVRGVHRVTLKKSSKANILSQIFTLFFMSLLNFRFYIIIIPKISWVIQKQFGDLKTYFCKEDSYKKLNEMSNMKIAMD